MAKGFQEAYDCLTIGDEKKFRIEVMQKCEWSEPTLNNKKAGRTPLKNPELEILSKIFKKYNISLWY